MKRALAVAALLLAAAGSVAARETPPSAAVPAVPIPILEPAQRWAFDGFSIEPPQEARWYSLAKTRSRAVLVRRTPGGEEDSFATVVAEQVAMPAATPEAFLAAMQARRARERTSPRSGARSASTPPIRCAPATACRRTRWCRGMRRRASPKSSDVHACIHTSTVS